MSQIEELLSQIEADLPGLLPVGSRALYPIDSKFLRRMDAKSTSVAAIKNVYAVEPLLDELNELLSRCLAQQRFKQELAEKFVSYWLAHKRDNALLDKKVELLLREKRHNTESMALEIKGLENIGKEVANVIKLKRDALAWRSPEHDVAHARVALSAEVTGYLSPHATEAVKPIAMDLEKNRLMYEELNSRSDVRLSLTELERIQGSIALATERSEFLKDHNTLRHAEQTIEREAQDRRRAMATERDSPLNYGARIDDLQAMFDVDFSAALSRAKALEVGLEKVYGIAHPRPKGSDEGILSAYVVWSREILELLFAKMESSTELSIAISLRARLNLTDWERLVKGGTVSFPLTDSMVGLESSLTMIRGIQVEVRGTTDNPAVGVVVEPPITSSQDRSPRLFALDILPNDVTGRTGQVHGRPLHNRSPWGDWRVRLTNPLSDQDNIDVIILLGVVTV